jgi:hypothetical protein
VPREAAAAATTSAAPAPTAPPRTIARDTAAERAPVTVRRLRRGRLAIRKIDPWAVLKFSLVFYFCMMLIFILGLGIIFAALKGFGVIDKFEKFLGELSGASVALTGGAIFKWVFIIGIGWTIIATAVTTFISFLYNLIADVVGGIELLVTERE